jgi:hypothetical protein
VKFDSPKRSVLLVVSLLLVVIRESVVGLDLTSFSDAIVSSPLTLKTKVVFPGNSKKCAAELNVVLFDTERL